METEARKFPKGMPAYFAQEPSGNAPLTAKINGENTFVGFGINVIDGKDFDDAIKVSLLADEVYGNEKVPAKIDSSGYTKGEYTASVKRTLEETFNSLSVSCKVETGKSVPFFSGSIKAMYGEKQEVKSESQFYRVIYSVTTKKHTIKSGYIFADDLRTLLGPGVLSKLDDETISPDDIFYNFGTHVILSHSLGGDLNVTGIFNSDEKKSSSEIEVAIEAACAYVAAKAETKLSESQKHIGSQLNIHIMANGGDVSSFGGTTFETLGTVIKDWAKSATKQDTQTISFIYQYLSIWKLASKPERRAAIEKRFWQIAEERGGELSKYFTRAADPSADMPLVPGVTYRFRNKHADYMMHACKIWVPIINNTAYHRLILMKRNGSAAEKFDVAVSPNIKDSIVIRSQNIDMVIGVDDSQAREGNIVKPYERDGTDAQYFTPRKNSDGTVSFLFTKDKNYAIDTSSDVHGEGTWLVLKKISNDNTQKWYIESER
ncbi:MAG: hypothetical protein LBS21_10710 [Clostridiales bacterium]|nr:hypothetical protein [Clostridiales bacterium]